jgi:anthranilate synthase component 1
VDFRGNLDTCIAIRTVFIKDGRVHLQAGAGIVADSDPMREQAECEAKARGVLLAIERAAEMEDE